MNAVHRAGVDTGPVATARLGYHMGHRRAAFELRADHVLPLRLAAVAAWPAVDLADAPEELGDRIHQTRVATQHSDVAEHVAQHLTGLRRPEEHLLAHRARDVEFLPKRLRRNDDRR